MKNHITGNVLRTRRLRLEPLDWRHASGMYELWSSPEVCRYSGPAQDLAGEPILLPAGDQSDSNKILAFFLERAHLGTGLRWALITLDERRFVGAVGFNSLGSCCEIAYHLHPRSWGRGLMAEACRSVVRWAFDDFGASAIEAYIEPDNEGSIRLAQRLGFASTGESEGTAGRYLLSCADDRLVPL